MERFAFGMKMDEQRFEAARPTTLTTRIRWEREESLELRKFGGNMESVAILGVRHDRDLRFKYR
ncbi:hypothetical protein HN51_043376 [Arachis hypogaea]